MAAAYAHLLATVALDRGLIGPREVPRLWERHLLNCAVLGEALEPGCSVADVGSGAGLPGIPLAIARPDLVITLVEPMLRRATFLEEAVAALGLERVEVVRSRAEQLHGLRRFPVVTSRALAPLERLLDWCVPLVAPGGAVVAMKGSTVRAEVEAAGDYLERRRLGPVSVHNYGAGLVDPPIWVVRVEVGPAAGLGWDLASPRTRRKGGRR